LLGARLESYIGGFCSSVSVHIAELTAGAEAILFACKKAVDQKESVLLDLPLM
jgi:hypothetical protein